MMANERDEREPLLRVPATLLERLVAAGVPGTSASQRVRNALEETLMLREQAGPLAPETYLPTLVELLRQAEVEARSGLSPSAWFAVRAAAHGWFITPGDGQNLWMEVQDTPTAELGLTPAQHNELVDYLRGLTPLQATALALAAQRGE